MAAMGLYLPQLRMDWPTIVARARAADEAGLASLWLMDHLAPPAGPQHDSFEGWTIAAALAPLTERIRIGHLVLCEPFRHPSLVAKMAATIDHVSGGRFDLGLGWGSVPAELRSWGFGDAGGARRADRLDRHLGVIRRLLAGEDVAGEEVRHDGVDVPLGDVALHPRPLQQPLPIHVGGAGERRTLPIVARHADWWSCPTYAADRLPALATSLRAARPDLRISVQRPVGLAASGAERADVVADAERRFGSWGGLVAGTPDEVAAALRADVDAGADLVICQLSDFGRPETIRLLADEVAPALASS